MRIGGIHYKGEDVIRAYKNGVMIWHLVDFTFCSCEEIELFTLPFVSLYDSSTWNLAEKQSIPIDFLTYYPLYASQGKKAESSWSGIQKIPNDCLRASNSGNSIGEKTIDFVEGVIGYASRSANSIGSENTKLLPNAIGYASPAEQMLPYGPIETILFAPAYFQPSQIMKPKGEQFLIHYLPLLSRPSGSAISDGWILSKIYFPLMAQWSEAYCGTSLIKDNIEASFVLDERDLVKPQQNILHSNKALMQLSPMKEVEVLYKILTKLRDLLIVDKSRGIQKYFVIQNNKYSYIDFATPEEIQKNNAILNFLNTKFDLAMAIKQKIDKKTKTKEVVLIQLPFCKNVEIYKSANGYLNSLLENSYVSAHLYSIREETKNINILKLNEALDYDIFASEQVLNKSYFSNSDNENMFSQWKMYSINAPALNLSSSRWIEYFLEIFSSSLKTLFELGGSYNSKIQYSSIVPARGVLKKGFGQDNFVRYQSRGKSGSIFGVDERIRSSPQEKIKSLSGSRFTMEEPEFWKPAILIKSISGSIFRNDEPIAAKYTKSENVFLFMPYLEFIEAFEGFLEQGVNSYAQGFLEQNSGLLFLSGLSNNHLKTEVNDLILRERVSLILQEEARYSEGYLFLSFIDSFTGLKENFMSKGAGYLEQWDTKSLKISEDLLYKNYATIGFAALQGLNQFIAYFTHNYITYLQDTELLLFGNLVSRNYHFSLLNLILKQSAFLGEGLLNFLSSASVFATSSFSQAENGSNKIKNAHNSVLSFDENYRWLYPYYLDDEETELFIYQVKNFSYKDKSFI